MICFLTTRRAEVDQQELIGGAELVRHGTDHFSSRRCHGNPDCSVGVIAAVHLQQDCTRTREINTMIWYVTAPDLWWQRAASKMKKQEAHKATEGFAFL